MELSYLKTKKIILNNNKNKKNINYRELLIYI